MSLAKAQLVSKENLTDNVFELRLKAESEFKFEAGQFITIKIEDGEGPCFRAYSIASAPNNGKEFSICVKIVENGRGSNWLNSLSPSDEFEFIGPHGNFIFKNTTNKNILFIATGTGIAPFKSMIEDQLNSGSTKSIHLIFGVRYIKGLFYTDFFKNLAKKHENFTFKTTLSQPEEENYNGNTGRVTKPLESHEIEPTNTDVYICGLNPMIESVTKILKEKGLDESNIFSEKYD